ncbi:NAD(P)/FAD-dependent oxidoreductase [Roseburia sp. 499]|uniref:NAD(P)/FAD-dependent oxidoreductase n=1 Tax=Roseburia sp. 499 TaxID=1261634 RepID=UPI0009511982|nr:NAD(P)-binding protein [Roseburia sp. 499]WVK71425.1 FAD-dependent oxidoreductase [Roseburia sp. 499]
MIRIQQLKLPISHTEEQLKQKIAKMLRVPVAEIKLYKIRKQSIDARKKQEVSYVYTVDVQVPGEEKLLKKLKSNYISLAKDEIYDFPESGTQQLKNRPVIIGSGPAGLFCGYLLAQHGYKPVIIERGRCVEERQKDVETFWKTNVLDTRSNVQFGEGGAGTFSDGKLNTLVKDVKGRNKKVLDIFISHGAPEKISYVNKPHIGTDILIKVVADMRRQIEEWGGKYLFETCVTDVSVENGSVSGVVCRNERDGSSCNIPAEAVVLAIGHSARDTFEMLLERKVPMEAKSFAVGMRVEHPQQMISENQYGEAAASILPAASYKLTANLENGRGVYSFCMCPGGYVVNASSEEGRLAVNGMSYSGRNGKNANSAIIVTVTPEDFGGEGPLSGVAFQRKLEERAYELGNGMVPQQLFGDFEKGKISEAYGAFSSELKGNHTFGALHTLFPKEITESFIQGMHSFAKRIPDFDRKDAILSGVESRTSSPVRIPRDENFESSLKGLYPCGEGAGYAGGIMSAAMDGMKIAEEIVRRYKVPDAE